MKPEPELVVSETGQFELAARLDAVDRLLRLRAIAWWSTVALLMAVGAGVAVGIYLVRQVLGAP